jgi:hypothetical protein
MKIVPKLGRSISGWQMHYNRFQDTKLLSSKKARNWLKWLQKCSLLNNNTPEHTKSFSVYRYNNKDSANSCCKN